MGFWNAERLTALITTDGHMLESNLGRVWVQDIATNNYPYGIAHSYQIGPVRGLDPGKAVEILNLLAVVPPGPPREPSPTPEPDGTNG